MSKLVVCCYEVKVWQWLENINLKTDTNYLHNQISVCSSANFKKWMKMKIKIAAMKPSKCF